MSRTVGGMQGTRATVVVALILGALGLPAGAAAEAPSGGPQPPVFTPAEASAQLDQAVAALTGEAPAADPTTELRDLALALPALSGAERRTARRILARPPSGEQNGSDIALGAVWSPDATRECFDSPGGQFAIHYVTSSNDAPPDTDETGEIGVWDYVERVAARADTAKQVENGELGWPPPKNDNPKGNEAGCTGGRTDIYLSDLCCTQGVLYGYAAPDDPSSQCRNAPFKCFAYLVLDNDYAEPQYGYDGDPDPPLKATLAHEYNHVLQFNLDSNQDQWMFESTAVWAEEKVFPEVDDWLSTFMGRWANGPHIPITKPAPRRIYGTAVWNHWLELGAGYGPDVILDAWKASRETTPKDFAVKAYERAIRQRGGGGFSQEFGRFAAATAEWRVETGEFPDQVALPTVKRRGTLVRGKRAKRFRLDHAAYRLLRVKPRRRNVIRLRVRAPRRVRTAIALVGRDSDPVPTTVATKFDYAKRGGRLAVRLRRARRFERITAVVANADGRIAGFGGRDWAYRSDNERFRVALR